MSTGRQISAMGDLTAMAPYGKRWGEAGVVQDGKVDEGL